MNWVRGTLYPGVKCPQGQDTVPMVSCLRGQDKPEGGGGDILPWVKVSPGTRYWGGGQDKLVHWFFNLFFNKN